MSLLKEMQETLTVSTVEPAPTHRGRRVWAALACAINFLYAVYLGALGVLLPLIGRSFGLPAEAQARIFPANFTGMVLGVLLCGYLSDRLGRRRVLMAGMAAYAAGLALFAKSPVFGLALVSAAVIGAGSGSMQTVANALAANLFAGRRNTTINAMQIAFGAGAVCGPLAASRLLALGADWRSLYLGLSAVIVLLFVSAAVVPSAPSSASASRMDLAMLPSILGQPGFFALCLAAALYAGAEVGFFQWMPSYFHQRLPGGARWAGVIVSIFWIGMTLGRLAAGGLISRLPLPRMRAALAMSGGLSAAAAVFFPSPQPTMAFVALTGLCFGGIFSIFLAETGERFPHATGTAFGIVVATSGVGTALVPWAIGALAATPLGWRGALGLVPLCAFAVAVNAMLTGRSLIRR